MVVTGGQPHVLMAPAFRKQDRKSIKHRQAGKSQEAMSVVKKIRQGNGKVDEAEKKEGCNHEKAQDKSIPGRGHNKCKGPEVGRVWCA